MIKVSYRDDSESRSDLILTDDLGGKWRRSGSLPGGGDLLIEVVDMRHAVKMSIAFGLINATLDTSCERELVIFGEYDPEKQNI
jgi:hypothetical protein